MEYLALHFTQSGAIKFYTMLKNKKLSAEMMPVPRALSSSCGIAVKMCYNGDIRSIISEDVDKLYEIRGGDYCLLYEAE